MRPIWLHDVRLGWRHPEIRREIACLTGLRFAWFSLFILTLPFLLVFGTIHFVGAGMAFIGHWVAREVVFRPCFRIQSRMTPYHKPIRDKLTAKGAMKWQIVAASAHKDRAP